MSKQEQQSRAHVGSDVNPAADATAPTNTGSRERASRRMARMPSPDSTQSNSEENAAPGSKIDQVLSLLRRPHGATLAELVEATGWQPHSTRAVLTGLRKKGRAIVRGKRGDVTCYSLTGNA